MISLCLWILFFWIVGTIINSLGVILMNFSSHSMYMTGAYPCSQAFPVSSFWSLASSWSNTECVKDWDQVLRNACMVANIICMHCSQLFSHVNRPYHMLYLALHMQLLYLKTAAWHFCYHKCYIVRWELGQFDNSYINPYVHLYLYVLHIYIGAGLVLQGKRGKLSKYFK